MPTQAKFLQLFFGVLIATFISPALNGSNWFTNWFDLDRAVNKFLGTYDENSCDDSSDDSTSDGFELNYHTMLKQNNEWECGFYAIFHCFARKNNLTGNLRPHYDRFKARLFRLSLEARALYNRHAWLSNFNIQEYLRLLNLNENAIILLGLNFEGLLPDCLLAIRKINTCKKRGEQFWVIIGHAEHWTCHEITPEGNCTSIDSIDGYSLRHSREVITRILRICSDEVSLPQVDAYLEALRLIEEDREDEARDYALENGFTEEMFDELLAQRKRTTKNMDHLPEEQSADKKKSGQRARKTKRK